MRIVKTYLFIIFITTVILLPASVSAQKAAEKTSPKNVAVVPKQSPASASRKIESSASAIAQSVLNEINAARTEPEKYIKYLEDYRKAFKGNTVYLPNYLQIQTNEGTVPVDEAITFLKQIPKIGLYKFSAGLNQISNAQLTNLMENPALGHKGKDGSDLQKRFAKFGSSGSFAAENISLYSELPRQIVISMIVDDGVKSRSHRKNIFSPNFKFVGIAFGKGNVGQGLCVVDFADRFTESNSKSGMREF